MNEIYFDNSATTRISQTALKKMQDTAERLYGNPSSLHAVGIAAEALMTASRKTILKALNCRNATPESLIFCASGTEADNLALLGAAHAKAFFRSKKIITSDSEHPAVLSPTAFLEKEGYRLVRIPTRAGILDMDRLAAEMDKDTFLVSVMLVNNETGAVNDIAAISKVVKKINPGCLVHCDAVQGFMKIPFSPEAAGVDFAVISSHKIHGPKGIGALYVSSSVLKAKNLSPIIRGGGQENGFRSGTENLPGIAGFAAACEEACPAIQNNAAHIQKIYDYLTKKIHEDERLHGVRINQPAGRYAPHILSLTLPHIKSEVMLHYLSHRGIYVSSGSACSSRSGHVSRTLLAFGLSEREADATIRLSFSPMNGLEEAACFVEVLASGIQTLVPMF